MKPRIHWTERSANDLDVIEAFIGQHSALHAASTIARIIERVEDLPSLPHLGPMVRERNDENLRESLEGSYRIVYRIVDESRIDIAAVVHSARRLPGGL